MQTLVIYDSTGKIYYQVSGDVAEPTGIPFLWVEIPEGKYIKSIDTSVTPNEPIYGDSPINVTQDLYEKLAALETAVNTKLTENIELNLMVLEAMAETYETVLPFLP
ncbi:MAG: hypothetical protein WCD89_10325 [Anaerocolumna sp.]